MSHARRRPRRKYDRDTSDSYERGRLPGFKRKRSNRQNEYARSASQSINDNLSRKKFFDDSDCGVFELYVLRTFFNPVFIIAIVALKFLADVIHSRAFGVAPFLFLVFTVAMVMLMRWLYSLWSHQQQMLMHFSSVFNLCILSLFYAAGGAAVKVDGTFWLVVYIMTVIICGFLEWVRLPASASVGLFLSSAVSVIALPPEWLWLASLTIVPVATILFGRIFLNKIDVWFVAKINKVIFVLLCSYYVIASSNAASSISLRLFSDFYYVVASLFDTVLLPATGFFFFLKHLVAILTKL